MNIREILGKNVKNYRRKLNLSQEKFAELCGLHRTYVSDIECFRRNVSIDNIKNIADSLQIDAYKLLMETEW